MRETDKLSLNVYEKLEITALINPKIHTVTDAKHIGGEEDN